MIIWALPVAGQWASEAKPPSLAGARQFSLLLCLMPTLWDIVSRGPILYVIGSCGRI